MVAFGDEAGAEMTVRELVRLLEVEVEDWETEVKVYIRRPHDGDDEVFDAEGIEFWDRPDGSEVLMIVA